MDNGKDDNIAADPVGFGEEPVVAAGPPLGEPRRIPAEKPAFEAEMTGHVQERKTHRCKVFLTGGGVDLIIRSCPTELADQLERGGKLRVSLG